MLSIAEQFRRIAAGAYDNAGHRESFMLARSYRWRRQVFPKCTASDALRLAHEDLADGRARYPAFGRNGLGAPDEKGLAWCEDPASISLRFVGFADEIAGGTCDHFGWLTDEDGGNGFHYRGAVYQLPARDGRAQYVAGYREGSNHRGRRQWEDVNGESARLDFSAPLIFEGEPGGAWNRDYEAAAINAAHTADSIAQHEAEAEREYQAGFSAGCEFADLGETLACERRAALALAREIKAEGRQFTDAICGALREAIKQHVAGWREAKGRRAPGFRRSPNHH